jgi:hypothetical protein
LYVYYLQKQKKKEPCILIGWNKQTKKKTHTHRAGGDIETSEAHSFHFNMLDSNNI